MPERWWWLRPLILLAVVLAGVVLALTVGIPPIDELRSGVAAAGWAAPVLYAAIFAGLTLTPAPASVASIAAGVLFGFATGLIIVMAGALASAVVAFGLARMLGRAAVERVNSRRLRQVDALLRSRGLLAVIGVRLVPFVPFSTLNYLCGLSAVRFRSYLLGTPVGILPAATVYVTLGAYGATPGSVPFVLAVGGLAVLAITSVVVARRGRRAAATARITETAGPGPTVRSRAALRREAGGA